MNSLLLFILFNLSPTINHASITNAAQKELSNQFTMAKNTAIKGWVNEAFMAANSYDFVNYKEQLKVASHYFTSSAWKIFTTALEKSGKINILKKEKLFSVGLAEGIGPIILKQDNQHNQFTWKIRFPAVITYYSANSTFKIEHLIVDIVITSVKGNNGVREKIIQQMTLNNLPDKIFN